MIHPRMLWVMVLALATAAAARAAEKGPGRFHDVSKEVGLDGARGAFPSWCDYDQDGHVDLYAGGRLYRNGGPPDFRFSDVTRDLFGGSPGGKGVWADANNDGVPDLAVPAKGKPEPDVAVKLWMNDGKGGFEEILVKGLEEREDFQYIGVLAWADVDQDGWADLFAACSEDWNDGKPRYFKRFLFRNRKAGRFEDITEKAGIAGAPPRYTRGAIFGDFDNDGDADLYVANYRIEDNFLWENRGDGTFVNVAADKGVKGTGRRFKGQGRTWYGHSIAAAWGDLDNDGNLDLWVSNLVHKDGKYGYHRGYICDDSKIYLNGGAPDFAFRDARKDMGIAVLPLDGIGEKPDGSKTIVDELWAGIALGDMDNDGDLDAFVPQVYDLPWAFAHLYRNEGNGTLTRVEDEAGVRVFDTYSGAWADFDEDGFLDLATWGRPEVGKKRRLMLYRNPGGEGQWLKVRLRTDGNGGTAIGARLTLRFGEDLAIRETRAGTSSHGQQDSPLVHFGLGNRKPDVLEVRWPTGRTRRFPDPKPGSTLQASEPRKD